MQAPRLVSYLRNLRSLASSSHRSCSTKSNLSTTSNEENPANDRGKNARSTPVDREISLFGPKDVRAPLPGNVGPAPLPPTPTKALSTPTRSLISQFESDFLTCSLPEDRHASVFTQYLENSLQDYSDLKRNSLNESFPSLITVNEFLNDLHYPPTEYLECIAQECPELLRRDFATLFPGKNVVDEDLTVIVLSQKTDYDMNSWSLEMETEREELIEYFVMAAEYICNFLSDSGYWADYIVPTSGRPHLEPYTNDTFFETDERYRHFGFTVEKVGDCQVIKHHLWGTHVFLGSIFSNVPTGSPELKTILKKFHLMDEDY